MPEVSEWLARMGELTAAHRARRAERFARLARKRLWQRRAEGYSDVYAKADGAWYRARETGQLERPARVAACGAETLQITCQGCHKVQQRTSGCRIGLLCVPCRGAIARAKRNAFRHARRAVLGIAAQKGLMNPARRGGRWTEKLLTLTAPHVRDQTIAERIRVVLNAWRRFLRKLNAQWKLKGVKSAEWFRVFEWTPGSDQMGHPHVHLWIFSPYLARSDIEQWWCEAIAAELAQGVTHVIVDIRRVEGGDVERELIKYLTKDITSSGAKLAPEIFAEVYKALDGQRSTQASRGFMGRAKRAETACECGCTLPRQVRRRKNPVQKDKEAEE